MFRIIASSAVITLIIACAVPAASISFTGGETANNKWSDQDNWSTDVPSNGDDVTLPGVAVNTTSIVDVEGKTFQAETGPNLPAGGSVPDTDAQMYTVLADLPMINISYNNMNFMGGGLNKLTTARWRGNPNDSFRTMDETAADWADFQDKFQIQNGSASGTHGNRTTEEGAASPASVTMDLPDLNDDFDGTTNTPVLYVGHDTDTARPTWLTNDFTDTGKHLATPGQDPTWDVFSREISSFTPGEADSRGWISDGGQLNSLNIEQDTGGVTQTVELAHNLTVNEAPDYNVTAGNVVLDIGSYTLRTDTGGTIPDGVTVLIDGGEYGRVINDTSTFGSLTIESGGKLAGVGDVNPGRGDVTVEAGGTIEVGDGELFLNFPFGNKFAMHGNLVGNGTSSVLNLAVGSGRQPQLKGIDPVGPDATITGITRIRMGLKNSGNFGRFADPDKIRLQETTFEIRNKQLQWEVQVTPADVIADGPDAAFKLGAIDLRNGGDLKLIDTGSVDGDFAYIGELLSLDGDERIDLNDNALLTDMSDVDLADLLSYVDNSGLLGAPTVKNVNLGGTEFWYLAPQQTQIVPEPATLALLSVGGVLMARRRRN